MDEKLKEYYEAKSYTLDRKCPYCLQELKEKNAHAIIPVYPYLNLISQQIADMLRKIGIDAICLSCLPGEASFNERVQLAKDSGYNVLICVDGSFNMSNFELKKI